MAQLIWILTSFITFTYFLSVTYGYRFKEKIDTENGFCENWRWGKVKVNETKCIKKRCEEIKCLPGEYELYGCSPVIAGGSLHCKVESGDPSKKFPACCNVLVCKGGFYHLFGSMRGNLTIANKKPVRTINLDEDN